MKIEIFCRNYNKFFFFKSKLYKYLRKKYLLRISLKNSLENSLEENSLENSYLIIKKLLINLDKSKSLFTIIRIS